MLLPDLAGAPVLVTGATQGIGRAVARALLAQGATVFGVAIDARPADEADHLVPVACDLRDPAAIRAAFEAIRARTDRLDGLANIAGVDPKYAIEQADHAAWDQVMNLNLRAYYLVIREALPLLRAGRGRSIVNVSSINYRLGQPRRSIYSTSKAGILGLTTGLARELGAQGIRINSISPGWVFTERQVAEYFTEPADRRKHLATLAQHQAIPLQIQPEDIANHVLFYLSAASRASTGHNCVVDAGWLLE